MNDQLRQAFTASSRGYSPDRVVADPELNQVFLGHCRKLGMIASDASLNFALLNLRKQGALRGLRSKRSAFPDEDQYRFAAEMAARLIERRDNVSLDQIICDPSLASEFDELAAAISPGFRSVEYRWAALNLRKSRRLKPELLSRVIPAQAAARLRFSDIDLGLIPARPGLYLIFTASHVLYIGEAENLNNRIRKHLDHSDNKVLARWLWDHGLEELYLEIHVLPDDVSRRVRRALEVELILSRDPQFNVKR